MGIFNWIKTVVALFSVKHAEVDLILDMQKSHFKLKAEVSQLKNDLLSNYERQGEVIDRLYKRFGTRLSRDIEAEEVKNRQQNTPNMSTKAGIMEQYNRIIKAGALLESS